METKSLIAIRRHAFAWVDSLDLKRRMGPPVCVEGRTSSLTEPIPVISRFYGFLLHRDAHSIEILTPELADEKMDLTEDGYDYTLRPMGLKEMIRSVIVQHVVRQILYSESTVLDAQQAVFLSKLAADGGLRKESEQLFRFALREDAPNELIPKLRGSGHFYLYSIFEDIAERPDWSDAQRRFRAFLRACDDPEQAPNIKRYVKTIDRMSVDERRYRSNPPKDRAARLVHALRYEPIGASTVGDDAANKLRAMGFAAVPALIDGMTDMSLSPNMVYGHFYGEIPEITMVGQVCRTLLEQITSQQLTLVTADPLYFLKDMTTVQNNVRAWWKRTQGRGNLELMTEAARNGGQRTYAAYGLVKSYPSKAIPILREALRASDFRDDDYADAIVALRGMSGEFVQEFLREVIASGKGFALRQAAISSLKDSEESLRAELDEWTRLTRNPDPPYQDAETIARFVLSRQSAVGFRHLSEATPSESPDTRWWLPILLSETAIRDLVRKSRSAEFRAEVEGYLIKSLNDIQTVGKWVDTTVHTMDEDRMIYPRYRDVALVNLCAIFSEKYGADFRTQRSAEACNRLAERFKEIYRTGRPQ